MKQLNFKKAIFFYVLLFLSYSESKNLSDYESIHKERGIGLAFSLEQKTIPLQGNNYILLSKTNTVVPSQNKEYYLIRISTDGVVDSYNINDLSITIKNKLGDIFLDEAGNIVIPLLNGKNIELFIVNKNMKEHIFKKLKREKMLLDFFMKKIKSTFSNLGSRVFNFIFMKKMLNSVVVWQQLKLIL